LGHAHSACGQHDDARKLHEEALALRKVKFGPDHPATLATMCDLAICLDAVNRRADALKLWDEALPLWTKKFGPDHPATLWCMRSLADSHEKHGRHDDALKTRREILTHVTNRLAGDHPDAIFAMQQVAISLEALGRTDEALKLFDAVLERRRATLAPDHRKLFWIMLKVARCRVSLGRGAETVPLIDECVQRAAGKPAHADIVLNMLVLRSRHFKTTKELAGVRATAEMWEMLNRTDANSLYNAACFRALTAAVAKIDPKTPSADVTRLATEEADRAMAWLRKAVDAGFADAGQMKKDTDFDTLRGREDFKSILAELEGKKK
jgi:tetratricopeptide (TPR) repeat protein